MGRRRKHRRVNESGVPTLTWAISGGTPQSLTKLSSGEASHRWPQVVPGSQAVLFTVSPTIFGVDDANVAAVSLKTGVTKILQRGGYYGRYLPGHLAYLHEGVLYGVRFDVDKLEVQGSPVPLLEDVASNATSGGGQFDFSASGTFSERRTMVYNRPHTAR